MQTRTDISSAPFILHGDGLVESAVLAQDAGRTADLLYGTVMAKVAASQQWVPLSDLTAVDGSAVAQGIYVGDTVLTASLVAGTVSDSPILVGGGVIVDASQVVLENSLLMTSTLNATGGADNRIVYAVKDCLAHAGIFAEATTILSNLENA